MPAHGKTEVNNLKGRESYRLLQWLDAQRDFIHKEHLEGPKIAELATTALKFEVTVSNIRGACKVIDLVLPLTKVRKTNAETEARQAELMAKLPQTLADILARLDRLEKGLGIG